MTDMERQVRERLGALASEQGIPDRPASTTMPTRRRMTGPTDSTVADLDLWRSASNTMRPKPSARTMATKVTVPVPKDKRDLEGRYATAPNDFIPGDTVRIFILAVEWGGIGNSTLRATGREVTTKNIVITAVDELTNIGDAP